MRAHSPFATSTGDGTALITSYVFSEYQYNPVLAFARVPMMVRSVLIFSRLI